MVTASIQKQVILTFELPGVNMASRSGGGIEPQFKQLDAALHREQWQLKINHHNVLSTIEALREVLVELERFAAAEELKR